MPTSDGWVNKDEANIFTREHTGLSVTTIMTGAHQTVVVGDHVILVWCETYLDVCVICRYDTITGLFAVDIIKH